MLSNRRLVATCAFFFCCNVVLLTIYGIFHNAEMFYITIDENQTNIITLPDDFLSIGIDTSKIANSNEIDFQNKRFQQLTAALAPARLRLGGTMSDRLIFSKEDIPLKDCKHCPRNLSLDNFCSYNDEFCQNKFLPFFIMTGNKFTEINQFCKTTRMKLLFSLNVLLRDDLKWNHHNTLELLEYSKMKGFQIDWQLGNEPNSFQHVFNVTIPPKVLAHDFRHLRKLLDYHGYHNAFLVGPDTTRPQPNRPECLKYMVEFLGNGSRYINIRSWHQYYLNSRTAKLDDFWNPYTFNLLKEQIYEMKKHTTKYSHIPMWLTETSSSYGGGAPGLSNSYAGTPLWVDKLGLAAKNNITTVIRQSLYGGNYSLISDQFEPLPDWWVSVIFKKLVGNKVLNIKSNSSRFQRMYAHCTNRNYTNDTSAITIYAVNLEMAKARFLINGTAVHGKHLTIDEFIISAPSNNRKSKTINLNGWPLYFESSLPNFEPRRIKCGNLVSMPPYSIAFWVIKNTFINVCKN